MPAESAVSQPVLKVNKLGERARVENEHSHVNSAAIDKLPEENFLMRNTGMTLVGVYVLWYPELFYPDKGSPAAGAPLVLHQRQLAHLFMAQKMVQS